MSINYTMENVGATWNYHLDDYLAIDKKTEEVIAVSGNSDFTAEELGLRTIGNNREYYVVKVVNTHSKTKWK
tara:strand:- start:125 stop:340 length:216 start_codon:yes stop_codon:yes gene_type:complete